MDSLHNEGTRSAYACAEAQALFKTFNPGACDDRFQRDQIFGVRSPDIYLLWEPRPQLFGVADGGFGSRWVYKLSANIINLLNPVKIQMGN